MSWSRAGRREFLGLLERRVDWRSPGLAGTTFPEGDGRPELAVYSSLRRGWFFGSEKFREKLLGIFRSRAFSDPADIAAASNIRVVLIRSRTSH